MCDPADVRLERLVGYSSLNNCFFSPCSYVWAYIWIAWVGQQYFSKSFHVYHNMRDVISAATRLNLVGPLGGAVLQHHIARISEAILNQWKDIPVEEACQTG